MKTISFVVLAVASQLASADTILGVYAGVSHWQHDMTGDISADWTNDSVRVDLDDAGNNYYLALEHGVPMLPNVRLMRSEVQAAGVINVNNVAALPGQSFAVQSDIDFSHTGLTLYYELFDNWVNFDLGLSFKYFDGGSDFHYPALLDERSDFDDVIPLLYAKAKFDLPLTGWSVYGSADALSFKSNDVHDFELGVNYESQMGLGAVLGYRSMTVDLIEIGDTTSDLTIDGLFAGINFHF